mmetsp:Transcript_57108/g.134874  ORF Transcript_57108/g.134874 Transcript_57108/m.134874 type:complete len:304 (+) Transcript_57108:609-1520(+)
MRSPASFSRRARVTPASSSSRMMTISISSSRCCSRAFHVCSSAPFRSLAERSVICSIHCSFSISSCSRNRDCSAACLRRISSSFSDHSRCAVESFRESSTTCMPYMSSTRCRSERCAPSNRSLSCAMSSASRTRCAWSCWSKRSLCSRSRTEAISRSRSTALSRSRSRRSRSSEVERSCASASTSRCLFTSCWLTSSIRRSSALCLDSSRSISGWRPLTVISLISFDLSCIQLSRRIFSDTMMLSRCFLSSRSCFARSSSTCLSNRRWRSWNSVARSSHLVESTPLSFTSWSMKSRCRFTCAS